MVLWHVDDLEGLHVDSFQNTRLIHYLHGIYGANMSVNRGKKNRYLSMDLNYSEEGVLNVSMCNYIDGIIEDFPKVVTKSAPSPHSDNLFWVRDEEEVTFLPKEQGWSFHHAVAQLFFLLVMARKDIQTAVAFLTARVKKQTKMTREK